MKTIIKFEIKIIEVPLFDIQRKVAKIFYIALVFTIYKCYNNDLEKFVSHHQTIIIGGKRDNEKM